MKSQHNIKLMRTTITIPDLFYKQIKSSLEKKGFNTINEYLLSLIRADQHQNDAKKWANIGKGMLATNMLNGNPGEFFQTLTPQSLLEEDSKWPSHYLGKPLSGKKASCPICYESVPTEFAQQHYAKSHGDI
jgi:hypothetical protein